MMEKWRFEIENGRSIIRTAKPEDLKSINLIYNKAVEARATADLTPVSYSKRKEWFDFHDPGTYPVFVFEMDDKVVGWLSFSPYRKGREALRMTAEISYYVDEHFLRKGIGTSLVNFAIRIAPQLGFRNLFAIILENNFGSINLMKKLGFEQWGFLPKVADFNGELVGHFYYGKHL